MIIPFDDDEKKLLREALESAEGTMNAAREMVRNTTVDRLARKVRQAVKGMQAQLVRRARCIDWGNEASILMVIPILAWAAANLWIRRE